MPYPGQPETGEVRDKNPLTEMLGAVLDSMRVVGDSLSLEIPSLDKEQTPDPTARPEEALRTKAKTEPTPAIQTPPVFSDAPDGPDPFEGVKLPPNPFDRDVFAFLGKGGRQHYPDPGPEPTGEVEQAVLPGPVGGQPPPKPPAGNPPAAAPGDPGERPKADVPPPIPPGRAQATPEATPIAPQRVPEPQPAPIAAPTPEIDPRGDGSQHHPKSEPDRGVFTSPATPKATQTRPAPQASDTAVTSPESVGQSVGPSPRTTETESAGLVQAFKDLIAQAVEKVKSEPEAKPSATQAAEPVDAAGPPPRAKPDVAPDAHVGRGTTGASESGSGGDEGDKQLVGWLERIHAELVKLNAAVGSGDGSIGLGTR